MTITDYSSASLRRLLLLGGALIVLLTTGLAMQFGFIGLAALFAGGIGLFYTLVVFRNPSVGFYGLIFYTFVLFIFDREVGDLPFGTLTELIMVITLIGLLIHAPIFEWSLMKSDLFILMLIWVLLSLLQLTNPDAGSIRGWVQEIRPVAIYPLIFVLFGLLFFKTDKQLNTFLYLIILLSCLAALNAARQQFVGLTPGEKAFLDAGAAKTHVLFGQLRAFSFMRDAGQFGASQAQMALTCIVLALGPFKGWKKVALWAVSLLLLWGMLLSGTRGAFYALISGAFMALLLSKNFKVLIGGVLLVIGLFCFLKYTTIGQGSYQIRRMRTALDPNDASFNVRLENQQRLAWYLESKPFGGGLGSIGRWGKEYNPGKFLSTIEPDSYWVKVWAMYGITGLILWFSMIMYLFGKCGGMIWNMRSPALRTKLIALLSGAFGLFVCSYGNEVMNSLPSLTIFYLALVSVYRGKDWDDEAYGAI